MPKPKTTEEAFKDLDERMIKLGQDIGNIKRYLGMAELSYKNGDHIVARRHLKRALDLEFAIVFDCEAGGTLAELWYPGEDLTLHHLR